MPAGLDAARALVDGFVTYWDRHRAVLRTRNLAAQEGDVRFREVRNRTLLEFNDELPPQDRGAPGTRRGRGTAMSPAAAAAALVALIERMAAFHRDLEPIGHLARRPRRDDGAHHPPDGGRTVQRAAGRG